MKAQAERRRGLTRRTVLILALGLALVALVGVLRWRDRSIDLAPGHEPMSVPTAGISFSVRLHRYSIQAVPADELPYAVDVAAPIESDLPRDASGVRMYLVDGHLVDHPVSQAQYALGLLNGYRLTGDPERLELARRQADRLLARAVRQGDAIYFPYPFDFPLHDNPDNMMRAPWYSAMAQGLALSVFVQLSEATGDETYRVAATQAFASFRHPRADATAIWTTFIDRDGYYWPEEYPADTPDRTFNGMVFAAYGLYDYYRLTGDPDAGLLFQATLTTVQHALPGIRVPGGVSYYCLEHAVQNAAYHAVHIGQLEMLSRLTGDRSFAEWADLLRADHDPAKDST
ncbi:MAG: D-glucuronyl C5-epimerase family protein [Candidatus Limnocylindria bacterium]